MPSERVTAIMNDRVTPLPASPVLSSAESPWSGFLFEVQVVQASREEIGWSWHHTHIGVCTAGRSTIRVSGAAGEGRFLVRPSCISIFPGGCDHTDIHHSGGGIEFVVVEIDPSRLERLFHDEAPRIDSRLVPQLYAHDPRISALIGNMRAEVEAGCPTGTLYGESLSLALAAYVSSRYSIKAPIRKTAKTKFSRTQARTVLDYIQAHLGRDFSMVELAGALELSPRHISRLFRNTFGTTVHRYIVKQRIKQAKALLSGKRLPLVDISERLGFASQSHFTDVFRKTTGISPGRYRQEQ